MTSDEQNGGGVEVDAELRKTIDELSEKIETLDHYALLNVERTADKKSIKRAYYDLAAKYHPDRFFRQELGAYKIKVEAIFRQITLAHDALTNKAQRAEYDAYLTDLERSRNIETVLQSAIEKAQQVATKQLVPDADEIAKRRELLARRLLGNRQPVAKPPVSTPPVKQDGTSAASPQRGQHAERPHENPEAAMAALRARYEERVARAKEGEAGRYIEEAERAMATGDVISAAGALRVASTLVPSNPEWKKRYEDAKRATNAVLVETYTRQATYEEKSERWLDAARSWRRILDAAPDDAHAHDRTAHAMTKEGGNLQAAREHAERAVALKPKHAPYYLTLANVYLAAGLVLNAKRALETAARFAPDDVTIQALLKRIHKHAGESR